MTNGRPYNTKLLVGVVPCGSECDSSQHESGLSPRNECLGKQIIHPYSVPVPATCCFFSGFLKKCYARFVATIPSHGGTARVEALNCRSFRRTQMRDLRKYMTSILAVIGVYKCQTPVGPISKPLSSTFSVGGHRRPVNITYIQYIRMQNVIFRQFYSIS